MDTDSFLNAWRRFIARGQPHEIKSDNGGNLTCGEKELRDEISNWNQQRIHEFLLQQDLQRPTASHMGGVWERAIRTTRKVLMALVKQQTLDDESLSTLMCEVEAIRQAADQDIRLPQRCGIPDLKSSSAFPRWDRAPARAVQERRHLQR